MHTSHDVINFQCKLKITRLTTNVFRITIIYLTGREGTAFWRHEQGLFRFLEINQERRQSH